MKNNLILTLLFVCTFLTTSCSSDDQSQELASTIDVSFIGSIDTNYTDLPIDLENTTVEFTNKANGTTSTIKLDKNGIAKAQLRIGQYNIVAKQTLDKKTYNDLIDQTGSKEPKIQDSTISFTANIENLDLQSSKEIHLKLQINKSSDTGLVFKQIYYAGSSLKDGSAYRDQFVEIYNNSPYTEYLDGILLVMLHNATNKTANRPDKENVLLANGGYNWNKSQGNTSDKDLNKDFVYAKKVFKFPGSGKQYPIEPGKSIIVAATAIDHTKNFIIGKPSEFVDPNKTVDLSQADFDVYLLDYLQNTYGIDITEPKYKYNLNTIGIDKMKVIKVQERDISMRFSTDDGILLIKLPTNLPVESLPVVKAPKSNDNTECIRIPIEYTIDAVQIRHATDRRVAPRKIPESLDRGNTFVPNGTYSSESLFRKTRYTLSNGRRVLLDTNNSTEDFTVSNKPIATKAEDSFFD